MLVSHGFVKLSKCTAPKLLYKVVSILTSMSAVAVAQMMASLTDLLALAVLDLNFEAEVTLEVKPELELDPPPNC